MTIEQNLPGKTESDSADDLLYVRVAGLVFGQPLLVSTSAAETVGAYLRTRMEGAGPQMSRFAGRRVHDPMSGRWKGYRRDGNVGIVSITGELVNRGAWLGADSGLTSYEGIVEQVGAAARDPDVATILLDINSPGGEAWGMVDAARTMRAAAGGKRMVAVFNSVGTSAAYGIGTAADEIVITESGLSGSIGVVTLHFDRSESAAKAGVRATVITNSEGARKAIGHPFGPLSEDDIASIRARADRIMDGFVNLLTDHRPGLTADAIRGQQAATFIGQDAVDVGLADRVGTFESVLAELSRASGRSTPSSMKGKTMTDKTGAPAAETDAGITQEQHDQAVAAAEQRGFKAATERLTGILSADGIKGDAARMTAAVDLATKAPTMSAEDVTAFVKANVAEKPAAGADVDKVLAKMDAAAEGITSSVSEAGDLTERKPAANTPEGWKAEWEGSEKLQAEYPSAESYVAFQKREQRGKKAA